MLHLEELVQQVAAIVPPYMVEHMARSEDPRVRERALVHLARAAAVRAVRSFAQQMPAMMVTASTTGRKQRLIYDARKKDELPGRLVRSEGEAKSVDVAVNEAYDYSGDTFDFFFDVFARNSLDDAGMSLISSVHVAEAAAGSHRPNEPAVNEPFAESLARGVKLCVAPTGPLEE